LMRIAPGGLIGFFRPIIRASLYRVNKSMIVLFWLTCHAFSVIGNYPTAVAVRGAA
jgi:hypothetical protein